MKRVTRRRPIPVDPLMPVFIDEKLKLANRNNRKLLAKLKRLKRLKSGVFRPEQLDSFLRR